MKQPTFLRAAVEDWHKGLISNGRLFELWGLPFRPAYLALLREADKRGVDLKYLSGIEGILNRELESLKKASAPGEPNFTPPLS